MIRVKTIAIDASSLGQMQLLSTLGARYQIARNIMEGCKAKLIKTASEKLHSTRADYIAGIQPITREGTSLVLALVGVLPNMVENGWDERFLHETLLSDEVHGWKLSAEGYRYRSIPFRHKTPGAGPQGGQPMGSQYSGSRNPMSLAAPHAIVEDTMALGKKIHGAAKKLVTAAEEAAGKGSSRLGAGMAPLLRKHHATDIYAGMIVNKQAVQKPNGKPGEVSHQRTYTTFRTISEAHPDAWYHPGIQARDFMDTLGDYVRKVTPGAIQAYVDEVLK